MRIVTIDFEASCLPRHGRSFPIEVGIAHSDGTVRSWLIRSAPEWSGWDWTEEAQALHHITPDLLDREGLSVDIVCAQLAEAVAGCRVIADSHLDAAWLNILANAAGAPLPFKIEHIEAFIDKIGARVEDVSVACSILDAESFVRHRAGEDARWLARFVTTLGDVVSQRSGFAEWRLFKWEPRPMMSDKAPVLRRTSEGTPESAERTVPTS